MEKYGIQPGEKVIFLPAYNVRFGKYEPATINYILNRKNEISENLKIIIRPFPGDKTFNQRYEEILSNPEVLKNEYDVDDPVNNFNDISDLLKFSDVVITGTSSAALEAMFFSTLR